MIRAAWVRVVRRGTVLQNSEENAPRLDFGDESDNTVQITKSEYADCLCVTGPFIGRGLNGENKPGHNRIFRRYSVGKGDAESTPVETGTAVGTCHRDTVLVRSIAETGSLGA